MYWCRVTEETKREYVNLVARHRMTTAIKPQINSFLEGFWDLVPKVSFHSFLVYLTVTSFHLSVILALHNRCTWFAIRLRSAHTVLLDMPCVHCIQCLVINL